MGSAKLTGRMRTLATLLVLLAAADRTGAETPVSFRNEVLPILAARCQMCWISVNSELLNALTLPSRSYAGEVMALRLK